MKCAHCGAVNPEDRAFCRTCGFVLPKIDSGAARQPETEALSPGGRRYPGRVKRKKSRKGAVVGVVVAVLLLLFFYYWLSMDDTDLGAYMDYEFVEATQTTDAQVHIWGNVTNWGDKVASGVVTIRIYDPAGNTLTEEVHVGPVAPLQNFPVDVSYTWPYPIIAGSEYPVTVEYSI